MLNSKLIPWWLVLTICGLWGQLPAYAVTNELPPAPPAQMLEKVESPKDSTQMEGHGDEGKDFTLRRLEKIQAETVIVEAQVARAKALKSLEDSGSSGSVPDVTTGTAAVAVNVSQMKSKVTPLPQINEIYGAGNRLIARLALGDGSYAELTTGQQVPGTQLKITSISAREVRVSALDGAGVQSLPFN
ncbi:MULTISPECIES: type IV pilus biogenesis protein PilP [Serratia]|uniref:type IV pilus biogenesis protein PilP n=1 Tax=Serratia TaxID=613 RepID=UPI0006608B09|nr:type IV pilus biogenesis protein PilP [Serratia sp. 506_PEND]